MEKNEEIIDKELLSEISDYDGIRKGAYNIRKNGQGIERKVTENINIVTKTDKPGIDIYVKENTKFDYVHIPVILAQSGLKDVVYNDFYIGKNANVVIIAGCGIHNDHHKDSQHDGIHRFFLEEGAKVKYIEKHYGEGVGDGKRVLNPVTEVYLGKNAYMVMETSQIKGVDDTVRTTKAVLESGATLVINEKILTTGSNKAKTIFDVKLNGKDSSTHVTSRSVAEDTSYQEFNSNIVGNNECYGHIECDAIIKEKGQVKAVPQIFAKDVNAKLIHEASIGKIAGEQFIKLMSLGIDAKSAEELIIKGFLK